MNRREFVALAAATPLAAMSKPQTSVRLGIDIFSLRSQNWTPFQYLDYAAKQQVQVVHFSEIRFLGSLDPENLKKVREHAEGLGLQLEIGMKSICPSSKMFDASAGTAEQQLSRMIDSAKIIGSPIVRAVLGSVQIARRGQLKCTSKTLFACCTTFDPRRPAKASRLRLRIMPATCRPAN